MRVCFDGRSVSEVYEDGEFVGVVEPESLIGMEIVGVAYDFSERVILCLEKDARNPEVQL
jgi:hypothetical protein